MVIERKAVYAALLLGFYTFIVVFSIGLKFYDIVTSTIIITVLSYGWFLYNVSRGGPMVMEYSDMMAHVFVYSFISFSIIFETFYFNNIGFDPLRFLLMTSPVAVWLMLWLDFYFQRIEGKT